VVISEETQRLTRLVKNLLDMARIEAGELHPVKQWNSVSDIFSDLLDRCSAVTSKHRVVIDLDESLPSVKVDSLLIAEVLTNLLENAAKYSPSGSEITVKAELDSSNLIFSVTDQGQGILPEEIDRIFDKFFRGTRLNEQSTEGTGMGLAIAQGIVKVHSGRIWAESNEQGSTFKFTLPIERKDVTELIHAD